MVDRDEFESEPKGQDFFDWAQVEIEDTRKYLEENYFPTWEKQLRLFLGDHWSDYEREDRAYKSSDNPAVQLTDNQIGPYVEQLTNTIVSQVSRINVKPTKPEEVIAAALMQTAAQYEWEHRNFHGNVKKAFKDSLIFGYGVGEVGYNVEVDESATPDKDGLLEYRSFIKKDAPYFRRIFPPRFLYDLSACEKNLDTARWCAEQFYQSPRYVISNRLYEKSVRSDIANRKEKPETVNEEKYSFSKKSHPNSVKGLYTMTRFWDKKFHMVYIFCKGVSKPLLAQPWPWEYLDDFPIKFLPFIEHPDDWYPINLTEWVEDDQYELNRSRTAMCQYRRSNTGGSIWVTGEVTKGTKDSIYRGDKIISGFEDGQTPQAFQTSPFPQEQFIMDGIFQRSMERKIGLGPNTRGNANSGRRSATEIQATNQFTMELMEGYVENVDKFVHSIASDLIKHIKANYDVPRMHQIAGPMAEYWGMIVDATAKQRLQDGQEPLPASFTTRYPQGEFWPAYDKEAIQGEFDITIETTAKSKLTPEMQMANLIQFEQMCERVVQMAAAMQAVPPGMPWTGEIAGVNFFEILRKMAEMMEIKDAARIIAQFGIIPAPIQTHTALEAQNQQPAPAPPTQETAMMQGAVDPTSQLLGGILGGGMNNPQ